MSAEGEPIWMPDPGEVATANVSRFARWLTQEGRVRLTGDYLELWRWSAETGRLLAHRCARLRVAEV